jgi:ankyrin repeat protein
MSPYRPVFLVLSASLLLVAALIAQSSAPEPPIFAAIRHGSAVEVGHLLQAGADANAIDADGTPALMAATLFADARLVERLLARGADPNRPDASGATALMWAVPDLAKMRALIGRGAKVNANATSERTALLVAASYPRAVPALRLLIDSGADLRAQDRAGSTALSLAVRSADSDVVRFLVERGLDMAALSPAARRVGLNRPDRSTTDLLLSKDLGPGPDVLVTTTSWQPTTLVDRWIASGADVNARNAAQYGRTPLLTAVTSELQGIETLKTLLDHGADPSAPTTEGETPLDWATYKGDRAKIQLLESRGAVRGDGPRRDRIQPPAAAGVADSRMSVTRGVQQLLNAGATFREKTACISCHHNALPALAAGVARRKGIEVSELPAGRTLGDIVDFLKLNAPRVMLGDPAVGGEALTVGYALRALAANAHPAGTVTATMTHWLLARQMPDGSWLGNGVNRPPSEYSVISHTAMATGGLVAYPLPGRASEIEESLGRARRWLLAVKATSAEERNMRLMGLVWTKAPKGRVEDAVREVRASQEAAGGWSQFGRTDADAYATGQSLHALHLAGVPVTDDSYRRGIAFLLASQYQDGAWLVRTHSFPLQRYFESGFPFGRHQWISAAGTAWAALAIANTLPDVPPTRAGASAAR